jgi:hypothetical protein
MSDLDHARRQAEQNHFSNPQTPMAEDYQIRDAAMREAYNAELARQRQLEEERRRQQGG